MSASEVRRIALAAQGFAARRDAGSINATRLRKAIDRLGLLQIDSVSVLVRAHYLPPFSRLGAYDRALLDAAAAARPKRFFEYWGHEASLLPVDCQPLLRWRMDRARRGQGVWRQLEPFADERRAEADTLLARIEREGPLAASDIAGTRAAQGMWVWSAAKHALEWLFWAGLVASTHRRGSFERVYDLPEWVLPRAVLQRPTPDEVDARRELIARAARALGVPGVAMTVLAVLGWRRPVPKTKTKTVGDVLDVDALEMVADMLDDAPVTSRSGHASGECGHLPLNLSDDDEPDRRQGAGEAQFRARPFRPRSDRRGAPLRLPALPGDLRLLRQLSCQPNRGAARGRRPRYLRALRPRGRRADRRLFPRRGGARRPSRAPQAISVPLKIIRSGLRYDELSEAEKTKWDMLEWGEDEIPDSVEAAEVNKRLFNVDTIDHVIAHFMEKGVTVEGGDRLAPRLVGETSRA